MVVTNFLSIFFFSLILVMGRTLIFEIKPNLNQTLNYFFELELNRTKSNRTYYDFKSNSNLIFFIMNIVPTYKLDQP
jgi:hypothetical protein